LEIEFPFRGNAACDAPAQQAARISFLDTLSLFKDSQCARKLETRTQYKADGVCFPIHPAAELVGRHSSILVDPFFARGLAICCDEISLPDRVSNQIQNQHVFHGSFSRTISTAFVNQQGARQSFFVSHLDATDQDPRISRALFMQDSWIRKNAYPNLWRAIRTRSGG